MRGGSVFRYMYVLQPAIVWLESGKVESIPKCGA